MKISVLTPTIRPDGLKRVYDALCKQTFKDFEWIVDIGFPQNGHDLNASYNRMIRRSRGELLVSWQDFISAPENTLEIFWNEYQKSNTTFVTCPVGKTLDDITVKYDWRNNDIDEEIDYLHCEFDLASFPKKALYDIGGFDEELDQHWSMDNISVCKRAEKCGYDFKNIRTIKAVAYDHDAVMEHPFRKKYRPVITNMLMDRYENQNCLHYLDTIV